MPSLKNTFTTLLLLLPLMVFAQTDSVTTPGKEKCAFEMMRIKSGMKQKQTARHKDNETLEDDGRTFIIPVVVHIIYDNLTNGQPGPENIPDSVVHSQIDVLNEDFGRYGRGSNINPLSEDAKIRFCLATRDPQGNPTTGIVRIQSPHTRHNSDEEMLTKNLSRWDQKRYLNIWVVRDIDGNNQQQGYAYLPNEVLQEPYFERDGIVVNYRYFGRNSKLAKQNNYLGHTTSHEAGHYLQLLHIWGEDGAGQGGCGDDDEVFDTPDCSGIFHASYNNVTRTCEKPVQCGAPRMTENYMDYSEDRCLNLFTKGQIARMRLSISVQRPALVSYENQVATGCKNLYLNFNPPTEEGFKMHASLSRGIVYLYPNFTAAQNTQLYVYDETGRLVAAKEFTNMKNDLEEVYIPSLKNGLYLFVFITPNKKYTEKMVILPDQK